MKDDRYKTKSHDHDQLIAEFFDESITLSRRERAAALEMLKMHGIIHIYEKLSKNASDPEKVKRYLTLLNAHVQHYSGLSEE